MLGRALENLCILPYELFSICFSRMLRQIILYCGKIKLFQLFWSTQSTLIHYSTHFLYSNEAFQCHLKSTTKTILYPLSGLPHNNCVSLLAILCMFFVLNEGGVNLLCSNINNKCLMVTQRNKIKCQPFLSFRHFFSLLFFFMFSNMTPASLIYSLLLGSVNIIRDCYNICLYLFILTAYC